VLGVPKTCREGRNAVITSNAPDACIVKLRHRARNRPESQQFVGLRRRDTRGLLVTANGEIVPPCGRCRELIHQIDPTNWDTKVVLSDTLVVDLRQLLPDHD